MDEFTLKGIVPVRFYFFIAFANVIGQLADIGGDRLIEVALDGVGRRGKEKSKDQETEKKRL